MKTLKNLKRCKCRLCVSEKVNPVINLPLVYVADKYGKIKWKLNKLNHHWGDVEKNIFYIPSRKFVSLPKEIPNNLMNSELKNCDYKKSAFDTLIIFNAQNGKIINEIDLMSKLSVDKNFIKLINFKIKQNKEICKTRFKTSKAFG